MNVVSADKNYVVYNVVFRLGQFCKKFDIDLG